MDGLKPAAKAGQRSAFLRVLARDLSGMLCRSKGPRVLLRFY
jgi:hypothetical protein